MINLMVRVGARPTTLVGALICPWISFFVPGAFAGDRPGLFDIYAEALFYDGVYQKARSEHGASRELSPQARAGLLPSLSLSYQKSHTRQNTVSDDTLVFPSGITKYPSETFSLTLTQPVFRWSNIVDLSVARLEMERADIALALQKVDLMTRVVNVYLDALEAWDEMQLSLAEEASVGKQLQLARTRYEAEIGRRADFYEAQARLSTIQANTTIARNAFQDGLEGLREVSGLNVEQLSEFKEVELQLPRPMNIDAWVGLARENNLDAAQQRVALEIARKQLEKEKSQHAPTVDLVARGTDLDTEGTEFGVGRQTQSNVVELRLEVPIYQGGAVSSRVRQASRLAFAAEDELSTRLRRVERETRSAFKDVRGAIRRVESLEQAVEAQALLARTYNAGYPSVYNSVEVLDAEQDLHSAQRDLLRARYDFIRGTLRLKAVAGQLAEEDLWLLNQWLDGQNVSEYEPIVEYSTIDR